MPFGDVDGFCDASGRGEGERMKLDQRLAKVFTLVAQCERPARRDRRLHSLVRSPEFAVGHALDTETHCRAVMIEFPVVDVRQSFQNFDRPCRKRELVRAEYQQLLSPHSRRHLECLVDDTPRLVDRTLRPQQVRSAHDDVVDEGAFHLVVGLRTVEDV
jgi:hypothetical protein